MNAVALNNGVVLPGETAPRSSGRTLLNLGCGADFHTAFVNIDLVARPGVVRHDLRKGIPFPDATCDLVYHSTMLSHLHPSEALTLTRECYRVLRPGGVLRIVTEDLEQMCRVYLEKLAMAWSGDSQSARDHEWMLLELYDQAMREWPGGEMISYAKGAVASSDAFIASRIGEPGRRMLAAARSGPSAVRPGRVIDAIAGARRTVLRALLGREGLRAYDTGRFRLHSGEVTYRMYDRYSLRELFRTAGFVDITLRTARESASAGWEATNLDLSPQGEPARPHAIIMEGMRPA